MRSPIRVAAYVDLCRPCAVHLSNAVPWETGEPPGPPPPRLGRFTLVNYHSSFGHDATAGDYAVFSPYATLGGGAHVGDDVFLGLHASIGPGKRIGARSKVSANSAALADAPAESLVHGVPGQISPLIR